MSEARCPRLGSIEQARMLGLMQACWMLGQEPLMKARWMLGQEPLMQARWILGQEPLMQARWMLGQEPLIGAVMGCLRLGHAVPLC